MAAYLRPAEPLSIGGVLDDGLRLYRAALKPLFLMSLALAIVSEGQGAATLLMIDPRQVQDPTAVLESMLPVMLVVFLFGSFMNTALISRLGRIAAGEPSTLSQALGNGVRRFVPLLIGGFLLGLAIVGGTILLVIPGLYLMVSLSMLAFPIVLDRAGPLAGLKISHRLVKGCWWRTATLITVAVVIAMVPYAVMAFVFGFTAALTAAGGNPMRGAVIQWLVGSVIYAFVLPIMLCIFYSIYNDLRVRKEGLDLERRLEAVPA